MNGGMHSWRALGVGIEVVVAEEADLDKAVATVQHEVESVDAACSRFRSDSELSRVPADGSPHTISPLLSDLVGTALRAADLTGGMVDPTVARSLALLGYDRDFDEIRQRDLSSRQPSPAPGPEAVHLDAAANTLALVPGTQLDLGATGKARLVDRAVAACMSNGIAGILVSCGGDIAVAGAAPQSGWRVRITDDSAGGPGPIVTIQDGAVATSSTTVRKWTVNGMPVHHIVNPVTGLPADGPYRTVSVAAATCVDANTASTAAIVLGSAAPAWLGERGLPARLVMRDERVVVVGLWPAEEGVLA
jgi:thiamine biosynthesis lipoprotein